MIEEYINKVVENGNKEQMHELTNIMIKLFDKLEEVDEEYYKEIKMQLYELACGKTINESMAMNWVENMKPIGEHWDMATTTSVLSQSGYDLKPAEFYVVMNMLYNDYNEAITDTDTFVKMSYEWLKDVDANSDKLYEYWKHISKK